MLKNILLLLLFLPIFCMATDLKPWFGNQYEFEFRATALYQNFDSISAKGYHRKHNENDGFLTLGIAYPFKRYCGEFEVTIADTSVQNYRWDNFRFTGRYQYWSQDAGDGLTVTGGMILDEAMSRALHDYSSFHHGHINGEAFLSIGRSMTTSIAGGMFLAWESLTGGHRGYVRTLHLNTAMNAITSSAGLRIRYGDLGESD